jgi:hypothetical protein
MGTRFAPGGTRPAPATTVAATRTELFPGIDRPTMVLWLAIPLLIASEIVDNGPLHNAILVAQGQKPTGGAGGLQQLVAKVGLIAFLYILALASDNSGTLSVLIVIALWVTWIAIHPSQVKAVLTLNKTGKVG